MFKVLFSNIWNIRKLFHHGWVPCYGIIVRTGTSISLLSVGFSLRFFN